MATWYHVNPDGSYHEVTHQGVGAKIMQPIEERQVAREEVAPGIEVSTVFLGLDHRYGDDGPPVLWETLVFGGQDVGLDESGERYTSQADALAGHAATVARVRQSLADMPKKELREALKVVCRVLGARGVRALVSEPEPKGPDDAWLILRVSPSQFAALARAGLDGKIGWFDE